MASPEQIRVRAVEGILAPVPGYAANHGMQIEYLGRRTDQKAIKDTSRTRHDGIVVHGDNEICYPPDAEHNSVFVRDADVGVFGALRKMIRDGDVAAADDVTAAWAGVKSAAKSQKLTPAAPAARASREESK